MIHRDRSKHPAPGCLDLADATSAAAKERAAVDTWIANNRPDPKNQRPDFKAYKNKDVAPALEKLFGKKCAYCESPYASLQPVDVEHWRPKADTEDEKGNLTGHGYEWLAMVWDNLLPSCIDCNRARHQQVPPPSGTGDWPVQKIGKANQFPIEDEAHRPKTPACDLTRESPLLLDPCKDDPSDYFEFRVDGIILPKRGLASLAQKRALTSIRVYALNRLGLVQERKRHILYMELEFRLIRFLYEASGNTTLPPDFRAAAQTLVIESLDRLRERTDGSVPYSQFIKERLRIFLEQELGIK